MRNLKIRTKLLVGFGSVLAMTMILGIMGVIGMNSIAAGNTRLYEENCKALYYVAEINLHYQQYRSYLRDTVLQSSLNRMDKAAESKAKAETCFSSGLTDAVAGYETTVSDEERAMFQDFTSLLFGNYRQQTMEAMQTALAGDAVKAADQLDAVGGMYLAQIDGDLGKIMELNNDNAVKNSADNDRLAAELTWAAVALLIASVLVGILFALLLAKYIVRPVKYVAECANELAKGNLDVSAAVNSRDETGDLSRSFGVVADSLRSLMSKIGKMTDEHKAGNIDWYIEAEEFQGGFRQVAGGINSMMKAVIDDVLLMIDRLNRVGDGDFDFDFPAMPGKKAVMTQAMEQLKTNLKSINGEIERLTKAALDGRLDYRSDSDRHKGGWGGILHGLNNVMDAVGTPIEEISKILTEMSRGNLSARVAGAYKGDFQLMKETANSTLEAVSSYISEISGSLSHLANDDYTFEVKREYVGDFSLIKESLNTIIDKLNSVMSEISMATEQVTAGARQISESSMVLAEGASVQASTVQELTASIITINEQTGQNADNAKTADTLSIKSKSSAESGNAQMSKMLASMQAIKEASDNIAKIIKVIDDIALQTNLLALNAAVEAASAGQHGKGFGVVAAEVRTLSLKSKDAAKETSRMIEEAIARVHEGTEIANSTSDALKEIVENVSGVSSLISSIAEASVSQAESISQASVGLNQISEVVQKNSATSQESAAAAQELSSQSTTLNNMLSVFKLKRVYAGR